MGGARAGGGATELAPSPRHALQPRVSSGVLQRQDKLMEGFDGEIGKYRAVIESGGNPVNRLIIVTNTPDAQASLYQRARNILGPDTSFEVRLMP